MKLTERLFSHKTKRKTSSEPDATLHPDVKVKRKGILLSHKLIATIVIAVIGAGFQAIVAFKSLGEIDSAFGEMLLVLQVDQELTELLGAVINIDLKRREIEPDTIDELNQSIVKMLDGLESQKAEILGILEDPQVQKNLEDIVANYEIFLKSLYESLSFNAKLGFDDSQGLRLVLATVDEKFAKASESSGSIKRLVQSLSIKQKDYLFTGGEENYQAVSNEMRKLINSVRRYGKPRLTKEFKILADEQKEVMEEIYQVKTELDNVQTKIAESLQLLRSQGDSVSLYLKEEMIPLSKSRAMETSESAGTTILNMAIIVSLITALILIWVSRAITSGLSASVKALKSISVGDLTVRLDKLADRQDEIGDLATSINGVGADLSKIVRHLISTSSSLGSNSEILNEMKDELISSNETMRASRDDVAKSSTQILHFAEMVAEKVVGVSQDADDSRQHAVEGAETVIQMDQIIQEISKEMTSSVETVKGFESTSENIGSTLEVITGLADQTNLLALNAAIEAARAGEQGRGFSVVADEVRILANKTVEATSNINSVLTAIQSSTSNTMSSILQVQKSSEACLEQSEKTVKSIDQIKELTSIASKEIGEASEQIRQVSTLTQNVTDHVGRMSNAIDKNEQSVEHVASTIDKLREKASQLSELSDSFKIN